nr:MAG TPA: hypothetical protein [Caudoviricetes sp.]
MRVLRVFGVWSKIHYTRVLSCMVYVIGVSYVVMYI